MAEYFDTVSKEIISVAKDIYKFVSHIAFIKRTPFSLVCVGQSPAYLALAMKHIREYNPESVEIVVLPYSKHGRAGDISKEYKMYKLRLLESNINLRKDIIILDYVISGNGIVSFKNTLALCFPEVSIGLITVTFPGANHNIPVYKHFTLNCFDFLLSSERIVQHYSPADFLHKKLIADFINLGDNMLARRVVDAAIVSVN